MQYYGRVFRPPSEAYSAIVQATVGCSHNKCAFCDMYKEKRFSIRPTDEVIADLAELSLLYPSTKRVFLGDGDAFKMNPKQLKPILRASSELFSELERVSAYATPGSILDKTPEEIRELRENGLGMLYLGLESGDAQVLERMRKGATPEEIVKAGQMVKDAGIELSVTAISGLGGKERWREHALETAWALSEMNPDYIGLLTLRAEGSAPLVRDINEGRFLPLTPEEVMAETWELINATDSPGSVFRANHISNYLNLAGTLNEDKPQLLETIRKGLEGKTPFKSEEARHWDLNNLY